jgi:uncharacterized protein YjaG (DUF416 family)
MQWFCACKSFAAPAAVVFFVMCVCLNTKPTFKAFCQKTTHAKLHPFAAYRFIDAAGNWLDTVLSHRK